MDERRSTYFAFQGLLTAVLLLVFLYQHVDSPVWVPRFFFLLSAFGASLVVLRVVSNEILSRWWFQAGLFVADSVLATITLFWTSAHSDLFWIYLLIIFGTALTRSLMQSFFIVLVTSMLYLVSAWHPARQFTPDAAFWIRMNLLWVTSALLAILSRDTKLAQAEQERRFRSRLIQVERLATLGQVAGEVAHRIKGPLTTIMANSEVLSQRYAGSPQAQRELKQIQHEVGHCKEILKNLLDLGRIEEMTFESLDLREPVRFALRGIDPQVKKLGLRIETRGLENSLRMDGDPSLLQEAVAAILQNAVDATGKGGVIKLWIEKEEPWRGWGPRRPKDAWLVIHIEDDGEGVDPGQLEKIFEPFFTTKGGEGSGLGLSAALRIVQKHNGAIEAYSEGEGMGSRFALKLPRKKAGARKRAPSLFFPPASSG